MGIWIDCIIVVFILLCVFIGYKKGLVKLGIRVISFLIAIMITFILYRPIANLIIFYTPIDESIQDIIIEKVNKEELNQEQEKGIVDNAKNDFLINIARPLSHNIVYGIVMILLFIIAKVILFFVSALSELVEKLPVIHQFNKIGGILYGIIVGFFITNLILLVISFISEINLNNKWEHEIKNTYITKLIYENNLFYLFLN